MTDMKCYSSNRFKVSILVDDPSSWIVPYVESLSVRIGEQNDVSLYFNAYDIVEGDFLFLLGCTSIIPKQVLNKNKHNLVVHESDLPEGRGWSPVSWQVLEGKNRIPIVLFEAEEKLDSGRIYLKDYIELDGTELLPEIKKKQGDKTIDLVLTFLNQWPDLQPSGQIGMPSYYEKRTTKHDELDISKSIIQNFNHLRIIDNEKHPAWFQLNGHKYILKIYKTD
ncbi:MAG: hypothetical protein K8F34_13345 [Candidatus Kuenenia stuttgartiensis]|nr:formyltransferase family protein [Candidatus Kuenenia stuttgartiensis]MBZ0192656.1 hypothetical protein [Candidatus Kuenenia stuttgartiensis]MCZ7611795.1 formyltransferase family protein [Ignavibacterium sp.]GJQ50494.1 MAG: hypothetical protein HKUEN01_28800 [Candidatus Kuenenia stuttgartiensis]